MMSSVQAMLHRFYERLKMWVKWFYQKKLPTNGDHPPILLVIFSGIFLREIDMSAVSKMFFVKMRIN